MTFIEHLEKSGINLGQPVAALSGTLTERDTLAVVDARIGNVVVGLPEKFVSVEPLEDFDDRYDVCIVWNDQDGSERGAIYYTLNGGKLYYATNGGVIIENPAGRITITQEPGMMAMAEKILAGNGAMLHS